MTLLRGSSSADIPAPVEDCWAVVEDLSEAPQWQKGLEEVDVVERDGEGRPLVCDTVTDATFTKVRCRVRLSYDAPHRLAFSRVESDDVREMEGSWQLEDLGSGRTRATYSLAVDPGKMGLLARPLEKALRPIVVGGRADELARAVAARR